MANCSVIIPCFNEFKVAEAIKEFELYDMEVIVVDDGSDIPIKEANIRHEKNQGYGAAIKTGIRHATRDYIITMDGDGQHSVSDVIKLWLYFNLLEKQYDMIVGVRKITEVNLLRYLGRKGLNWIASLFSMIWLPDLNSGLRIFRRDLALSYMPILSNSYSFTTSITLALIVDNYKVEWMPINVNYRAGGRSKVNVIKHGLVTLYYITKIGFALRTRTLRKWKRKLWPRV